jgi:hypothetical protein
MVVEIMNTILPISPLPPLPEERPDLSKNGTQFCEVQVTTTQGHATAQIVSRRPLTAEARVHAWVNPCGICGGQTGTGTGFSPSFSVFPCQ